MNRTRRDGPWDPGVQNERTSLAWDRTILGVLAVGILIVRQAALHGAADAQVCSAVVAGSIVVLGLMSLARTRRTDSRLRLGQPLDGMVLKIVLLVIVTCLGLLAAAQIH